MDWNNYLIIAITPKNAIVRGVTMIISSIHTKELAHGWFVGFARGLIQKPKSQKATHCLIVASQLSVLNLSPMIGRYSSEAQ